MRELEEEEVESNDEKVKHGSLGDSPSTSLESNQRSKKALLKASNFKTLKESVPYSILLNWENEGLYSEVVKGYSYSPT